MLMGNETHSPSGGLRRNPGKTFLGWLNQFFFWERRGAECTRNVLYHNLEDSCMGVCLEVCTDVSYTSATISIWLQNFDNHARITGINEFCLGPIRTYGLCSHYPFPSQTHQPGQAGVWAQKWLTFKFEIPSSCICGSSFVVNARSHTAHTHTHISTHNLHSHTVYHTLTFTLNLHSHIHIHTHTTHTHLDPHTQLTPMHSHSQLLCVHTYARTHTSAHTHIA